MCTQQALTTFQKGNPNQTIEYQLNIVEILRTCSIHKWLNSSKTRFSLALLTSLPMSLLRYCYTQLYSEIVCEQFTIQKSTQNNIKSNLRERTIWVPSKTINSLTPRTTPWHTDHLPYHTFLLTFFILSSNLQTTLPHLIIYNSRNFLK